MKMATIGLALVTLALVSCGGGGGGTTSTTPSAGTSPTSTTPSAGTSPTSTTPSAAALQAKNASVATTALVVVGTQ